MPYLNDEVYDQGLDWADANGTRVDINYTQEPTTYTEATSTYSCGNKTGLNTGAPENGDVDGRKVVVPAITDGSVTATQTAGWWSLTDGTSLLVAAGALSATQGVTSGNTFTLGTIDLTLRDPS
jgi:hypothetical protein